MDLKMTPDWNPRRAKKTLDFLISCELTKGTVLDIGEPNDLGKYLEMHTGCKLINTDCDLDYKIEVDRKFDTVFCFEVLEHLMNPRLFLDNLYKVTENRADIFLSFPSRPKFLWNNESHFHEYDKLRFGMLLEATGFEIIKKKKIYIPNFKIGIRPTIRLFIPKTVIYLLKKV